jgi:hypothetical protein
MGLSSRTVENLRLENDKLKNELEHTTKLYNEAVIAAQQTELNRMKHAFMITEHCDGLLAENEALTSRIAFLDHKLCSLEQANSALLKIINELTDITKSMKGVYEQETQARE